MKQFFNILKFELSAYFKNKLFLVLTLVLIIGIAVVLSFPAITSSIGSEDNKKTPTNIMAVADTGNVGIDATVFQEAITNKKIEVTDKTTSELSDLVNNEEYSSALIIESPTKYTYIVKDAGMYDDTQNIVSEIMIDNYRTKNLEGLGVPKDEALSMLNPEITGDMIKTGTDQSQNFFYTYILIFALYMAIIMYGQLVATSVASEKSSRAMELLITSAKPTNLMFGKVIGSGLAGIIQISAILASAFIFFNINKSYWIENPIVNSIFNMPLSILLYTVLFFILGYFIYAFLYGAVGSLVSKVEDTSTAIMPITFIFIAVFFVVMFGLNSGDVNSPIMVVASYFPLTSPMAMFVRIAMSDIAPIEIIISIVILIVSTIVIGYISAKIYKIGVLMYGKPPKLSNVLKSLKH